jgi:hypothetical protein
VQGDPADIACVAASGRDCADVLLVGLCGLGMCSGHGAATGVGTSGDEWGIGNEQPGQRESPRVDEGSGQENVLSVGTDEVEASPSRARAGLSTELLFI